MSKEKIMRSTQHGFAINVLATMTTENPQAFSREAFIIYSFTFLGEHYDMYYFFSVKQNVKVAATVAVFTEKIN